MSHNRIASVYNFGIVSSFIEHTHFYTEYRSIIHISVQSAFVRAYYHKFVFIDSKIINALEKCFKNLIRRNNIIKSHKRNCIVNSWIMCVKCNDIWNAHCLKLLKCASAVKRFTVASSVLTSSVENRHNYIDSMSLARYSLYNSL